MSHTRAVRAQNGPQSDARAPEAPACPHDAERAADRIDPTFDPRMAYGDPNAESPRLEGTTP